MRPRRMSQVARAVDGLHTGADVEVTSVVTDSRAAGPGALFVALPGEHTDGGLFVPEAFDNGAAGALLRDGLSATGPAVFVRSPGDAFLQLAADERRTMSARVVGITGANGKTSTKDMAAAVCATRLRTHASPESFNNEVGLPVTLLGAAADAEVVVAEMGARRKGDVTLLCEIARPDIVVVTNVGVAHLEIFGSWEAIVEASAEPVDAIGADGIAVLNADDPVVAGFAGRSAGRVVTFGTTPNADVRAEDVDARPRRPRVVHARPWSGPGARSGSRSPVPTWSRTRSPPPRSACRSACRCRMPRSPWPTPACRTGAWRPSPPPRGSAS